MATDYPIISLQEARNRGLTHYFTGQPCIYGHIAERVVSSGVCKECTNESSRVYRANRQPQPSKYGFKRCSDCHQLLPEREFGWMGRSYRTQCKECQIIYNRAWRKANPDKVLKQKENYKVHQAKYVKRTILKRLQQKEQLAGRPRPNKCELCNGSSQPEFDHCHVTGKFRGWLCGRCNRTLGFVNDSTELLKRMIQYLEGNRDLKPSHGIAIGKGSIGSN